MSQEYGWGQGIEKPSEPQASQEAAIASIGEQVYEYQHVKNGSETQQVQNDYLDGMDKQGMFIDANELKSKVRNSILKRGKPSYTVAQFYFEEDSPGIGGKARFIATHEKFQNTTLFVICLNALWMSIDTDWNKAPSISEAGWLFQLVEHSFCTFFTIEWLIRFFAFKNKCDGRKDGWFVFDTCLVALMVGETWILTIVAAFTGEAKVPFPTAILRLFRLLRLSRLTRMLRSVPNLLILIKGMMTAMQTVAWVMCLQILLIYVFAILFVQIAGGEVDMDGTFQAFANIPMAMWTLLIYGTFLDNLADFLNAIRDGKPEVLPFAMLFITLSALTVMNMLTGVLCDVVNAVAEVEKEGIDIWNLRNEMTTVMKALDKDENQMISYEEFCQIVDNPEALNSMQDVDVEVEKVVAFAELFFLDEEVKKELDFEEFIDMILKMRTSNEATVKDVLNVWMTMKKKMQVNYDRIKELHANVEILQTELNGKLDRVGKDVASIVAEVQKLKH